MKLATIRVGDGEVVAIKATNGYVPTTFGSMIELIEAGPAGLEAALASTAGVSPIAEPVLLAPIPRPGKIICAGINYRSHLDENIDAAQPVRPYFFAKLVSAVIGDGAPIVKPQAETQLDPEVELAVVLSRRSRRLRAKDAEGSIFGYTILDDVSARELQNAPDRQMTLGKGLDTFCPIGPVIVTPDEMPDPAGVRLSTRVNGEVRQDSSTAECFFTVAELLEALTRDVTLEPGDIVSTGTPSGVGLFRNPQVWLQPGDLVELEIEGIGRLRNPVQAGWKEP